MEEKGTIIEVAQELDYLVRARYPFIAIQTYEEQRVVAVAKRIAFSRTKRLFIWNCNRGVWEETEAGEVLQGNEEKQVNQPQKILEYVDNMKSDSIFVLQDFQMFIGKNPKVDRQIKDVVEALQTTRKTIIVTGTMIQTNDDLEKYITVVDFPMPDREVLGNVLEDMIEEVKGLSTAGVRVDLEDEDKERLIEAARGLTISETKNVFSKSVVSTGVLDEKAVDIVTNEKRQIVRKSGILEFYPKTGSMADIGGLDNLKGYIQERDHWWTSDVLDFGLSYLKGIVIVGIPGTGKSLTAKTMASEWGLPLVRLDMSAIFNKYVGGSEENIKKAMNTAEAVSPCVLWIDEVEKAMAVGSGDNGTSRRVFGQFLTWMQEKSSAVYVVCTANKVSGDGGLPPEFLRKGRFDDVFFVPLPSEDERVEIIGIHLQKKSRELSEEEMREVAIAAEGYSGAELEAAVENGLWKTFKDRADLTKDILIESVTETKPLSDTMKGEIDALQEWAKGRVRYASSQTDRIVKAEQVQDLTIEVE